MPVILKRPFRKTIRSSWFYTVYFSVIKIHITLQHKPNADLKFDRREMEEKQGVNENKYSKMKCALDVIVFKG